VPHRPDYQMLPALLDSRASPGRRGR
jgi:hypothetical protein